MISAILLLATAAFAYPGNLHSAPVADAPFVIPAWHPATDGDQRGPCPALNTLANHGVIAHTGQNISDAELASAFADVFRMDQGASDIFIGAIKDLKNSFGNLDLYTLCAHNVLEHDASLVRLDVNKDTELTMCSNIEQSYLDELLAHSNNGYINRADIRAYRSVRYESSQTTKGANFTFGFKQAIASWGEAGLLFMIFGNDGKIPAASLKTFLGSETLPADYKPRAVNNPITRAVAISEIFKVRFV